MKVNQTILNNTNNFKFQKIIVLIAIVLFVVKIFAWYLTQSVAIYSDALESVVNIIASILGLYSLYLVTKPKDKEHPYGHGKIEFLTSGVEGLLIGVAGIIIVIEAIQNLFNKTQIDKVDFGIYLVASTAFANMFLGIYALKKGKKTHSLVLQSTGKHLLTDTYSTFGIIIGLILLFFTNLFWIDSAIALIFSSIILFTAYKIIRDSISGIMDETDQKLIQNLIEMLQEKRIPCWIDFHNLRIIRYGAMLHIDLHLTLPFYLTVEEAHDEMERIDKLMNLHFSDRVELFIHTDPCQEFSCKICQIKTCKERKFAFVSSLQWGFENVSKNQKHRIDKH